MSTWFPVEHLAAMAHAADNPWKALLMMQATSYFDDSGTHRESVATIIGGYVATKDVWKSVERSWRAILGEFQDKGVKAFHATHCLAQGGEFERLERWECHYIYKQLSDILENSDVHAIWAAVRNDDWAAISDENFHTVYGSAYDFCVDRVFNEAVGWSSNHAGGSKVGVVVAVQKEHREETERTIKSWMALKIIDDRIGALTHEYPQNLAPLQTADMLAHEVYRHADWVAKMERGNVGPVEPIHPPCFAKITRFNGARMGGYFDREYLQMAAGEIREA